jgi:hypothetical protein
MFCPPGLIFDGTEGVDFRFHVYRGPPDWFRLSRGQRDPSAVGPIFMFCASELVFGGTVGVGSRFHALRARTHFGVIEGVGSSFHVLRARTHFQRYRGRQVPSSSFALQD